MTKYADDMYLLFGSAMGHTISKEVLSIEQWAMANKLCI